MARVRTPAADAAGVAPSHRVRTGQGTQWTGGDNGGVSSLGRRIRYGPTLVVGLGAATAVTVAVSRPWVEASVHQRGVPNIEASASGADIVPLAGALGVVVLAAFGAVIATHGLVRRALGVLIMVAAASIVAAALSTGSAGSQLEAGLSARGWSGGSYSTADQPWRWVALTAALLCVVAGAAVAAYGPGWATMGSRYDAPRTDADPGGPTRAAEAMSEADVWREIDRGRDPTQSP